ncbi:8458_t:CDS:2, partial [Scutellospora calospora]
TLNNLPQETHYNLPQETLNNLPQETLNNLPQETHYNLPQETLNNLPQETLNNLPQETHYNLPQETHYNLPQETLNNLSQETFNNLPQEILNNLPQETLTKLHDASNEFEVALWVAYHPKVLNLANTIRSAMKIKITENDNIPSNTTNDEILSNTTNSCNSIIEINKFQLQEECKALFLRTRNNTTVLYEELIVKVCKIPKSDHRMATLVKDVGSWYDVYRYRFHVAILNLANEFSATHEWEDEPLISELSEFISEDVWRQVLQLHLKATDLPALKNDSEMFMKLGTLVSEAVRRVLIAQQNEQDTKIAIRKCDEITLDLKIPTKFEIVKTLPVRELLKL